MEAYRNQNKLMRIKAIDQKGMDLEDESKWGFLAITPHPPSMQVGDQVVMQQMEGMFKSETMYRVINKTRGGQECVALYLGGGDSKEQVFELHKSWEGYPDDRLGIPLRIEKLLEDGAIRLEDKSTWQLTNPTNQNAKEWVEGQRVIISRGPSKIKTYQIKNLDTGETFFGTFMGWGR